MGWDATFKPRLRPVEAFSLPEQDGVGRIVGLRDRAELSDVMLSIPQAALPILAMMDGTHTCEDIAQKSRPLLGRPLAPGTLQTMLDHLERAHLLEGAGFERYYQSLSDDYRAQGTRAMRNAESFGIVDGSGALFDEMLAETSPATLTAPVVGLVAPHLDYARGRRCYGAAYATLRSRATPDRVVVLGTNHFGRSSSVVATANDFVTPLGTTRVDIAFLERLEAACGNLRNYEFDHAREHSIELQIAWMQHLFGARKFEMVPFLCPDPCGPTPAAPHDGQGVKLDGFAAALGELVAADQRDTLIVAGADLSHVGAAFGEDPKLEGNFLEEVRQQDLHALELLRGEGADAFVRFVATKGNPTRICSAGCIFALVSALPDATTTILEYHQAVDEPSQTGVTCAAAALT